MATGSGSRGVPSAFTIRCRKIRTAPEVASTGPLDRSMPPAMITKVMPSAMEPTIEVLRRMLSRLSGRRNRGAAEAADPDDGDEHDDDAVVAPDALDELQQPVVRPLLDGLHAPPPLTRLSRST